MGLVALKRSKSINLGVVKGVLIKPLALLHQSKVLRGKERKQPF